MSYRLQTDHQEVRPSLKEYIRERQKTCGTQTLYVRYLIINNYVNNENNYLTRLEFYFSLRTYFMCTDNV